METALGWTFHHKRMIIAAGALLVLFTLIISRPATITGHFTAETYDQKTDIHAEGSATYAISGAQLTHIQATGKIIGPGEVRIYLSEGVTRKLVYTNAKVTQNKITGMASESDSSAIQTNKLTITELESELPPLERAGEERQLPKTFNRACSETCILNPTPGSTYKLLIQTEPGTSVKIDAIHFSTVETGANRQENT